MKIFFYRSIVYVAVELVVIRGSFRAASAELIQDASQCATSSVSTSGAVTLSQDFYTPGNDNIRFAAFCLGSSELPVVSSWNFDNTFEPMETKPTFNSDNCGFIRLDECCLVDPTPGETLCDYSKFALCRALPSPEAQLRITCSYGMPGVLLNAEDTSLVFPDNAGYYYFAGNVGGGGEATVTTQPDGTLLFGPNSQDVTTVFFGTPDNIAEAAGACDCFQQTEGLSSDTRDCIKAVTGDICPAPESDPSALPPPSGPTPPSDASPTVTSLPGDGSCGGVSVRLSADAPSVDELCAYLNTLCVGNCNIGNIGCGTPWVACYPNCAPRPCSELATNEEDCISYGCTWTADSSPTAGAPPTPPAEQTPTMEPPPTTTSSGSQNDAFVVVGILSLLSLLLSISI